MPLTGKWEKEGENWKNIGDSEVSTHEKSILDRKRIEEHYKKRFSGPKKVFNVDIPKYHTHTRLKEEIRQLSSQFSSIAVQYSIGKSVGGKDLIVLKITEDANKERPILKPQVKYVANIHGDEVVGRELLIGLAKTLCHQYKHDALITNLLQTVEIHLLFSLNPDGFILKTRNNANDIDLNRGFPDWANLGSEESLMFDNREPEVIAVMNWIKNNSFILSLSFHDGWTMVIFPWDDSPGCTTKDNAVCSEDNTFYALAQMYAYNHSFMHTGHCPCHSEPLPIGNYRDEEFEVVTGGMQDYNYMFSNCIELTVEVSCEKKPPAKSLATHWKHNYPSLISLLQASDSGIKGLVVDEEGAPLASARVRIDGIDKEIVATERGEFWRILLPGTYILNAFSESSYGILESGPMPVTVTRNIGDGAEITKLVARIKLPGKFLVSSYQEGDRESVHVGGQDMLRQIFLGCEIGSTSLLKNEEWVQASVKICHIVFVVEVLLNIQEVVAYFKERWGEERIMRPTCSMDQSKLRRRLTIFLEEQFCEEKMLVPGWSISVAS